MKSHMVAVVRYTVCLRTLKRGVRTPFLVSVLAENHSCITLRPNILGGVLLDSLRLVCRITRALCVLGVISWQVFNPDVVVNRELTRAGSSLLKQARMEVKQ